MYVLFLDKSQFEIRLVILFVCLYLAAVVLDIVQCVCLLKLLLNNTLQYCNGGTNQPSVFRISVLIVTLKYRIRIRMITSAFYSVDYVVNQLKK